MTGYGVLFEPVRLGSLSLRNRLVMAPMGTCLDNGGFVTEDTVAYYRRRAEGGVGTITVEGCLVSPDTVGPEPRLSGPQYVPGLRRLVEALRPHDVTVGVQLMHPGRQVVEGPSVAPSPVPLNSAAPVPHELTGAEIGVIVADYASAAVRAREAGFDFVEVHGAHGYLPSTFLSPQFNLRTDGYGGDLARRARFSVEVARAIVAASGLPLVWRLNGSDGGSGGLEIDDAVAAARLLVDAGVSAISVTAGTWLSLQVTLAPMATPRGAMRPLAAAVRRALAGTGVPVMAVGRLDDPADAVSAVRDGDADLVLLGRGLIAEPDWPAKVASGRVADVRPCIACNACVDLVGRGERARCSVNPEVGRERTWTVPPADVPRRVMVVGSGPAGLEAARIARLRGHDVTLWERDAELGGKLEVAALAPSKHEVLRYRAHQRRVLDELGVDVTVGTTVDPAVVAAEHPDVLLVATGAVPLVPPIPGIDSAHVHDAQRLLRGEVTVPDGARVVVIGGSATGCETAELLADAGVPTSILEMRPSIGNGIEAITRRTMLRGLRAAGVEILTRATVVGVTAGAVSWTDAGGTTHETPADVVALAVGWRPTGAPDALPDDIEVRVVGDADTPADFVRAVNDGADAGLAV